MTDFLVLAVLNFRVLGNATRDLVNRSYDDDDDATAPVEGINYLFPFSSR
jgi:hypothetical protein